uniref:Uncharacterized protein n=1 Tax=Arundo donax TaxID=35708 RepID=A0A0A8ZTV7_ARUDO
MKKWQQNSFGCLCHAYLNIKFLLFCDLMLIS